MRSLEATIITALALALGGCSRPTVAAAQPVADDPAGEVVIPAKSKQLEAFAVAAAETGHGPAVHLNGRLVWDDTVTVRVFSPFAGRITAITAGAGETIAAGTALATITSPDYGQAQANARKAVADLQQAERTAARLRDLSTHGAVPQKDLQAAEADLVRAQSEKERTEAQLAFYGGSRDAIDQTYYLKAPIDGVVVEKNVNPGQEVRPDQMLANVPQLAAPLFVVSDPRRLWIQIDVSDRDLDGIKPGDPIVVHCRAFPGKGFPGQVDLISDTADPTSHMVRVRGSVDNHDRQLKAEMFVTAVVAGHDEPAVRVPAKAVFLKGDRHFLFVEQMRGHFARREVRVGSECDGTVAVIDGVKAGEAVVTTGCLLLEQILQDRG